jgi:hypothetical protein
MRLLFILLFIASASPNLLSQSNCPCCTPEHRQFDFWLGEWEVFDTTGTLVGKNTLLVRQDSCLIQENWTGESGGTGTSYNYYDQVNGTWNQLWIDNSGSALKLKGTFFDNKMVLESEDVQGPASVYRNRITWEAMPDGSVIQTWDAINECGKLQRRLFKGIYRKKDN